MNGKPINNQPGQPQQTYTVWERQCDNEQQLDCPVSVMKKCYPIRVPNCRTVTDIKRRTFQVNKLPVFVKALFFSVEIMPNFLQPGNINNFLGISWNSQK